MQEFNPFELSCLRELHEKIRDAREFQRLEFSSNPCDSGGSLLNYEIENYTATTADIWVMVPSLAAEIR